MGGEPIKPTAGIFIIQLGCVLLKVSSIEPVSSNEVRKVH